MPNEVLIKINDVSQNSIIKKVNKLNINILKVYTIQHDVYLRTSFDDYQKIVSNLKLYDIELVEYYGLKKAKQLIKKNYIIMVSFILSILMVLFSSQLIVEVDVIHENEELKQMIIDDLEEYGIKKFSFRKGYNYLNKVKDNIKRKHLEQIEWLEISKSGMRYIINVEERIITRQVEEKEYCHIVAKKNGLIKTINVYDGEALVSINDYVKKGDILISGDVKRNEEIVSHNCAEGVIYAEVWYEINVVVPLHYYQEEYTGKVRKNILINYNGIDYKVFNDRLKYYQSKKQKIFDLLGIKIYVETDEEVKRTQKKYTEKEAIDKGLLLAKEKILLKLKPEEQIIDEKILQKRLIDSKMNIDIFIIVEESIGQQIEGKGDLVNDL